MSAERSGNGAELAENGVSGSGAVSGHSRKRLSGSGAEERKAAKRRAGVIKIGVSAERQIGRSRSAQCSGNERRPMVVAPSN